MKASTLRRLINLWPPFLFSGIKGNRISADFREAEVSLHPRWYNRNYVGTHFGGSLFAMTDPWYMLLLMHQLGHEYVVWDQRADIEFVSPGRGTVKARFRVSEERLAQIIEMTKDGEKHLSEFQIDVTDESSELVARINKTVYIRRKLRNNRRPGAGQ
jgi:acyl-coenzyme A thioesterase PaaI-like protein